MPFFESNDAKKQKADIEGEWQLSTNENHAIAATIAWDVRANRSVSDAVACEKGGR